MRHGSTVRSAPISITAQRHINYVIDDTRVFTMMVSGVFYRRHGVLVMNITLLSRIELKKKKDFWRISILQREFCPTQKENSPSDNSTAESDVRYDADMMWTKTIYNLSHVDKTQQGQVVDAINRQISLYFEGLFPWVCRWFWFASAFYSFCANNNNNNKMRKCLWQRIEIGLAPQHNCTSTKCNELLL